MLLLAGCCALLLPLLLRGVLAAGWLCAAVLCLNYGYSPLGNATDSRIERLHRTTFCALKRTCRSHEPASQKLCKQHIVGQRVFGSMLRV